MLPLVRRCFVGTRYFTAGRIPFKPSSCLLLLRGTETTLRLVLSCPAPVSLCKDGFHLIRSAIHGSKKVMKVTDDAAEGRWIRLLRRTPRWGLVLGVAVVWTTVMLGMELLKGEEVEPAEIAVTGAAGLAVGAFALWFTQWQRARERKKPAGWPTATNVKEAVSTGRLPEGAAAEQWVPELARIDAQERYMVWIGPLMFGAFAAMGVFLIFENPAHPWFWVLATAGFVALAVWYPIWIPRRRENIQRLITELTEGPGFRPDSSGPEPD